MVFDVILSNAWKNGDPGLIFIDEKNRHNMTPELGEIEATNPCGEQPLLAYESCNLGSINLNKFVKEDKSDLNWEKLKETVHLAVQFLDNVIDINHYPIEKIAKRTRETRKIGLGIMGFADVLYQLNIKYDSEEGIKFGEKVMQFINEEAKKKSQMLAEKRGTFPAYEGSIHQKNGIKMRNACVTTVAPTGTIGMLAEASGGLEPNFAISFIKNVMDGTELVYTNKYFEETAKKKGFYSKELMREIAKVGSIQEFDEIPQEVKNVFVTAQDITPEWHIRMQAAFQKHVDASVSKTINFPTEAQIKDIEDAYLLAYNLKCKGITIYRDKSREGQVLNIGKVNKKEEITDIKPKTSAPNNYKSNNSQEFKNIQKAQEVSLPLMQNEPNSKNQETAQQNSLKTKVEEFTLPPIQPAREHKPVGGAVLLTETETQIGKSHTQTKLLTKKEIIESKICPECGSKIQIAEGCMLCLSCGFSACSV
jgi:ribonucleoside-diphosphate reductase alpha chain